MGDAGSRAAGIALPIRVIEPAQQRWRAVNSAHPVALVSAGAKLENGDSPDRHLLVCGGAAAGGGFAAESGTVGIYNGSGDVISWQ